MTNHICPHRNKIGNDDAGICGDRVRYTGEVTRIVSIADDHTAKLMLNHIFPVAGVMSCPQGHRTYMFRKLEKTA